MTIRTKYQTTTGTLTITRISGTGNNKMSYLWYESETPKYSREIQITESQMKNIEHLKIK